MALVALLPMRHTSERVPGKNYRPFAGVPLYKHVLGSLLECALIDRVVIDTDSPIIRDQVQKEFPQVTLISRPEHLRSGMVPMNEVLLHDVDQVPADFYLQTHSTNPLLHPQTIAQAIECFHANYPTFDSLFTVTRVQTRLWDHLARAVNHNPAILLRTQDLPPVYEENSCAYIFTRDTLRKRRTRIGERPYMFQITRSEAWDIDEELDFQVAEFLFQNQKGRAL
ncbi:acylneuraminate cytidylyltransferase family protein [bacterium]|nr:acylneuraminate cytidylyltransferase family protein [bacterium]